MAHQSLNHYAEGAVISFLHRYTAGIRPGGEPGYRSFRIQPVPGSGLTGTSAEVVLPGSEARRVGPGCYSFPTTRSG